MHQAEPFNPGCTRCPRLAAHLAELRRDYPEYHGRPVAPFGDPRARLLIVGLAPGRHGANRTGRPFTGDFAGILLYQALYHHGFSTQPEGANRDDGMELLDCRITNAVKCLPPGNKPVGKEIRNCIPYLRGELDQVPHRGVVLALGGVAHRAVVTAFGYKHAALRFAHGAEHELPGARTLLDSYHCSRYNTQTKRLTAVMFFEIIGRARALLATPESAQSLS